MEGIINNYADTVVSLDPRKTPFFGVGMEEDGNCKVWLNVKRWCVKIPPGLSDTDAKQINAALKNGTLVFGRHYIPLLTKDPAVVDRYIALIRNGRQIDDRIKIPFRNLVINKSDSNWTAAEIILACLKDEDTRKREPFIKYLKDGLAAYDGPAYLAFDYSNDPESYQITIDASGTVSTVAPKQESKPQDPEPVNKKIKMTDTKAKENAIKKFLE